MMKISLSLKNYSSSEAAKLLVKIVAAMHQLGQSPQFFLSDAPAGLDLKVLFTVLEKHKLPKCFIKISSTAPAPKEQVVIPISKRLNLKKTMEQALEIWQQGKSPVVQNVDETTRIQLLVVARQTRLENPGFRLEGLQAPQRQSA